MTKALVPETLLMTSVSEKVLILVWPGLLHSALDVSRCELWQDVATDQQWHISDLAYSLVSDKPPAASESLQCVTACSLEAATVTSFVSAFYQNQQFTSWRHFALLKKTTAGEETLPHQIQHVTWESRTS